MLRQKILEMRNKLSSTGADLYSDSDTIDVVLTNCEIFREACPVKSKFFECEGCNYGFQKDELCYDRARKKHFCAECWEFNQMFFGV